MSLSMTVRQQIFRRQRTSRPSGVKGVGLHDAAPASIRAGSNRGTSRWMTAREIK